MPGVHTFYDGSTILQPLADAVGMEVDKVNFVLCMFASLPLGYFYQQNLSPKMTSRQMRSVFPLVIGLFFCFFCFGRAVKHLLANCLISYALMYTVPPRYVHLAVFVFSMGYLLWIHFFRWMILTSYSLDITGPIMVAVQKITTLAFSLHDGTGRKPSELSDLQKREAVTEIPSIIDYLSYILNFQTGLTGPVNYYAEYNDFLDGRNIPEGRSHITAGLTKIGMAMVYLFIIVITTGSYPPEMIAKSEYLELPYYKWFFYWFFTIALIRVNYYFAWTFADGSCNMSGFGFSGKDEQGNAKWELCTNVKPLKVELAQSLKEVLDNWNIRTAGWLRRVAYDRTPKSMRTLTTYLLSAVWHGVSVGYYMSFMTAALFTPAAATWRRCMRWRFLDDPSKKFVYDIFSIFATIAGLTYATYPFVTMNLNPAVFVYARILFIGHIIALLTFFVLPKFYPPPKKTTESSTNSVKSDKKSQ